MFKDVKIGDRVWDVQYGWGVVECVSTRNHWPVDVRFEGAGEYGDDHTDSYTLDGKHYSYNQNPTLFWDEIKFEVPEKPVRLVDRTFEGWVNLYEYPQMFFHESKERAERRTNEGIVGPFAVTITLHGVPEGTNLGRIEGLGDLNAI